MKAIQIFLTAFLFSSFFCVSQENVTDSIGCKQGYWKEFKEIDGSKVLLFEGNYLNGRKTGVWKHYYQNGKLRGNIEFKDGKPNGPFITYFENGSISEKGTWSKNRYIGEFISYFPSGDIREKSTFTEDGKRNGEHISYYENGSILEEGVYLNGKTQGIYKAYYKNGKPRQIVYADSLKIKFNEDGKISEWEDAVLRINYYPSGSKYAIAHLKDGKMHGEILYYNEHEILTCKLLYENGYRNGPFTFYHENGKIKYQGAYKNDKMSGERICYDENGNLANGLYEFYQFGSKYICNYISGRPEGKLQVFDANMNLSMSIEMKNGMPHGAHIHYYNKGNGWSKADNYLNGEFVK